ncbi:autotransporter assembly complex protein TamB [Vibrio rumoiensis]|uniref:Translocation and assembly module TamB C-terminal domain-containing protein n=1 Tax=Vibrio rumoiensis 1S-45 TaxID=1188252 RepID=A0A1E5DYZ8_9VIBR|nr:translocation/assembly module TamB domain-containing protein [Vibrio rumoiensis]OEF22997.1 hypothetical protein A1QC_13045 [Vibrio rumoiensis 1S-45]
MRRLLKWLIGLILLIPTTLLVVLILAAILIFTNVGLSGGLWVAHKFVPELKVESTEGSLLPGFTLHNVEYINPDLGITANLKRLDFLTSLDCLFEHSVCLDTVAINGLDFSMPSLPESTEAEEEDSSGGMPTLFLPIPVSLTHLNLNDINLDILGYKANWQHFSTGLYAQGRTLTVRPTSWKKINLTLAPTTDEPPVSSKPSLPLSQQADIVLPEVSLPFGVKVEQFDINDFTLKQSTPMVVNHLGFQGQASGSDVEIKNLKLDMPEADLSLNTKVKLSGDYPLTLNAKGMVKMPDFKGQAIDLEAKGSVADLTLSSHLSGEAVATLNAKLQPLKATLPFELSLQDGKAQWPFKGKADYKIAIAHLDGKGSLEGYQMDLKAKLAGTEIPEVDLSANAQGNLKQITLEKLNVDTLGGNVSGQAMVNWEAPLNWKATLGLTDIQPGLQWPQAEGKISGSLINTGSLTSQGGWRIQVPTLNIKGNVRGYPLLVKGQLTANDLTGRGDYKARTRGLQLSHAGNGIKLKGKLDQQWDMDVDVDMPKLSKTLPDIKGQIKGSVQLRGEQKKPTIISNLAASNINWNDDEATLSSILLKGEVSPLPAPSGDLVLQAKQGSYQGHKLDNLNLRFSGNEKSHKLTLDTVTDVASVQLQVEGGLDQKPTATWKGQLQSASIILASQKDQVAPAWSIDHPVDIQYALTSQVAKVQAHCWQNLPSKVCLDKDLQAGQSGEANLSIENFTFNQLQQFIPNTTAVDGELNATAWAKWSPNAPPQVKLDVDIPAGKVTQKLEPPVTIPWNQLHLSANLKQNKLDMNWLLDLTSNGQIEGKMLIPNVQAEQMQIDGKNTIDAIHLGFLSPLLGEQNRMNASIQSDLSFKGPLLHPLVNGQFNINDLRLEGQMFPVDVNKGSVNTKFSGYAATLNSQLETADGNLNLKGDANWAQMNNWLVNLRAFGDELKVDVPPMVTLKVKPDLNISLTPTLAKITGQIDIPWGKILVEELPQSAVSVSKDEVLLDEDLKPIEDDTGLPMAVETDVVINIGDDVSLSAFGLKGNLVGSLKVSEKNKGPFILGEVRIEDGYYQSFGQDLLIKEGKILMNGPADQPYVAIKAIRNPDNTEDDVIAGIQVTGPADAPEVNVFSEPAMSQTSALSYLLRGRDIDDAGGGGVMTTALIGLSLAKSGKLVGQVGEAFGVHDMQLGTAGSGDDSQVTVSGYIAPGLQVKYGVGIFNALGEFTVRYELVTDFYIEAVTGLDSAVDFIYQFSFN